MSKKLKFQKPTSITFETVHSTAYRTVHADGVICTPNVHQNVHLAFYNEAPSLPFKYSRGVTENGNLSEEIPNSAVKKSEWTRQMEVEVVMSNELAVKLFALLAKQLKIEFVAENQEPGLKDENEPAISP